MDLLIYPRSFFGPNRLDLHFGLVSNDVWVLHWALHSFGLGEWDGKPIFLTPSMFIFFNNKKTENQNILCIFFVFPKIIIIIIFKSYFLRTCLLIILENYFLF